MKKKLLFLFALICSVILFSSCGDDDKDTTWTQIPDATKENTNLKINGGSLPDASASLDIQSAEAAVLKLTKAVYGHDDISVNVAMVKSNDSTYVFEGTANLDGAISKATAAVDKGLTVAAKGTVTLSGKLTVEVTTSGWGTLSGVYSGDSLKITVNGEEAKFKRPVTVTAQSETKATFVFEQIPSVANNFEMEVTLTKDGEGYKFEGAKDREAGYHVAISGTIVKNALTVDVLTSGYGWLNKTYSANENNKDKVVFIYNGEQTADGSSFNIKFKSETEMDITFSLPGTFNLDTKGKNAVKDIKYTKAADSETYTFEGSFSPAGYKASTITFKGSISPEKIFAITIDKTIKSDIVGKWNMSKTADGQGHVFIDFATTGGSVTLPDSIYNFVPQNLQEMIPQQIPDEMLKGLANKYLSQYTTFLKTIEFTESGNVNIVYNKIGGGSQEFKLEGFIYYNINDEGRLMIFPNLSKLLKMLMPTNATVLKSYPDYNPEEISYILMGSGIPFNYSFEAGELKVTMDNNVLTAVADFAGNMLGLIGGMLPGEIGGMLKVIVPGVADMLKEIPTLEIGLYLKK